MSGEGRSVLVTGARGFLGSQVLRALATRQPQARVWAGTRRTSQTQEPDTALARNLCLDLGTEISLPGDLHTVIHVAGEKRELLRMQAVNDMGTRRLVEAAAHAGVRRFVHVSSVGVYGASAHAGTVTESFPHTPRNPYETSKDAAESAVRDMCARLGIAYTIVQPSNVLGHVPGQSYPLLGLMRMVLTGRFAWFGRGEPWVNYVAVEDVAGAVVEAASAELPASTFIINVPVALHDLVGWIAAELNVAAPQRRLPMWLGQTMAVAGSTAAQLSGRAMPFNRERLLELTNTTRYDGSALTLATGYSYPVGVRRMLAGLMQAYRSEGRL